MSPPVFAYDVGSPYAWLAAERVDDLFEPKAEWLPILLGGVFRETGRSSWALTDARAQGIAEIDRRARERGLPPLQWPDTWPNDGLQAMRAATYAHNIGKGREFAIAAFRVQFTEGLALSDSANIARAATNAGLDPDEVLNATSDPDVKAALKTNTDRALELGVTGVPSVVVGRFVFWGDDHLDEAALLARDQ